MSSAKTAADSGRWLLALPLLCALCGVYYFGVDGLVGDTIPQFVRFVPGPDGGIYWPAFFTHQAEVFEPIPLLFGRAIGPLLSWNFKAQMAVNLLITGAIAILLQRLAGRTLARPQDKVGYFGLAFAILLFSPSQYADWLRSEIYGIRMAWLAAIGGICVAVSGLTLQTRAWLCALLALAASLCWGHGYFTWFILGLLLALGPGHSRENRWAGAGVAGLGIIALTAFTSLNSFLREEARSARQPFETGLLSALAVLGNSLGFHGPRELSTTIGAALLAVFAGCLLAIVRAGSAQGRQALPWVAICGMGALSALAIGFSRGPGTTYYSDIMKSHYVGFSSYFLVGLLGLAVLARRTPLASRLARRTWVKVTTVALLVVSLAFFLRSQKNGLDKISEFHGERAYDMAVLHFINVIDDPRFEGQITDALHPFIVKTGNPAVDGTEPKTTLGASESETAAWLRNAAVQFERSGFLRIQLAKAALLPVPPDTSASDEPLEGGLRRLRQEAGRVFVSGWIRDARTWKAPVHAVLLLRRVNDSEGRIVALARAERDPLSPAAAGAGRLVWETSAAVASGILNRQELILLAYDGESGAMRRIRERPEPESHGADR